LCTQTAIKKTPKINQHIMASTGAADYAAISNGVRDYVNIDKDYKDNANNDSNGNGDGSSVGAGWKHKRGTNEKEQEEL
jgi:hypothetical protein